MAKKKEYRVNLKGSLQGHYILASSAKEAAKKYPNELVEVHVWKTAQKGHYYPNKLTPYAEKKMGLRKVS